MPSTPTPPPNPPSSPRTTGKTIGALVLGAVSVLYILNPGFGVFELIPDNIPIVGNLDEAAATVILINCLAYFGLDLRNLMGTRRKDPVSEARNVTPPGGFGR